MVKCPLKPTADRLVLMPIEQKQSDVIVMLYAAPEDRGRVAAIGPDVTELAVGDVVLHATLKAHVITIGDKRYNLLRESDCLAKLA